MKMLVLVTDSEYESHCMNMLHERGVTGYTIIQNVVGIGKTGTKMGDRVHPGASVLLMSVIPDEETKDMLAYITACVNDGLLSQSTHAWIVPVDASTGL